MFLFFFIRSIALKSVTKHHKICDFMPNARMKRNFNETLRSDKMEIVFRCRMSQAKMSCVLQQQIAVLSVCSTHHQCTIHIFVYVRDEHRQSGRR